jgi:PKD repeat protein
VNHTFTAGGIYTAKLTVRDNRGGQGVQHVMITVNENNPANARPLAIMSISPRGKFAPVTMTADASASSDADGDVLSYEWLINNNQPGTGVTQTLTVTQPGFSTFQVGVADGRGGAASIHSGGVLVRDSSDPACKMVVQDFGGAFAAEVFLSNYGTTPTNGWQVWWQFPAGVSIHSPFNANVTGQNPYVASSLAFNGVIQPNSWISFGFYGQTTSSLINVQAAEVMGAICDNKTPPPANRPPVAVLTATPTSGTSPLTVNLSAAGSTDPDGDTISSYAWNFGDGSPGFTSASPTRSHVYTTMSDGSSSGGGSPVARVATVTVFDGRGGSDSETVTIIVNPPVVNLSCSVQVTGLWSNAYQLGVNLTNIGTVAATNPCVTLNFPESTQITSSTGGSVTSQSSTVKRVCLNGTLNPGITATISLQGTHDGSFTKPSCVVAVP